MPLVVATWNINSIRARIENVRHWLAGNSVDVLLLQEIKCENDKFPHDFFNDLGYFHQAVVGQKSYNGVALLSRYPLAEILTHLPSDELGEARYVECAVQGMRIACLYAPNGNPVGSIKFANKLTWLQNLRAHAQNLLSRQEPVVLAGDYNIIPAPIDVYDPSVWQDDALFRPESRSAFRRMLNDGWIDAFRAHHPQMGEAFTFWDYQGGAWPRDNGLRIDHLLLSPEAADRCTSCYIDRKPRGLDKASDHTVVLAEFDAA